MAGVARKPVRVKAPTFADTFAALWGRLCVTLPFEREYQFLPDRKFRFDFAWPGPRVAVEMEGGIWIRGGHTRGGGYRKNCEKYNLAAINGWRVLRYTVNDLREKPVQVLYQVRDLIESTQKERRAA